MMLLAKSTTSEVERDGFLWEEMREGNEFAFREIFDHYSTPLFQYGITIRNDRELVKDCVQELFIVLWTNRQSLGHARFVKYYLFFSLRRLVLKKLSKSKRLFPFSVLNQQGFFVEAQDEVLVRNEIQKDSQLQIAGAVQLLPARQREIIFLKFYQGLNNEEIKKIMNLNSQVVRNTLCKALNSLRKQLGKKAPVLLAGLVHLFQF